MNRIYTTLLPILDILDEGLRLYRRSSLTLLMLTAILIVPLAIGAGLFIALDQGWGILLILLLTLPQAVYLVGSLSRATLILQQGHSITLREALAIHPAKLAGMGCYSIIFSFVVNTITSILLYVCFCSGLSTMAAFLGGASAATEDFGSVDAAVNVIISIVSVVLILLFYVISLILSGATYSSLIYALQPFVQDNTPFGEAIQRSINLIAYRFGFNLLVFVITSLIFGFTALSVTTAIVVLLPLPILFILGEQSTIAQGISACAWIIGLIAVLPPMPIWMTLLYQRNYAAREGIDLAVRIETVMQERTAL